MNYFHHVNEFWNTHTHAHHTYKCDMMHLQWFSLLTFCPFFFFFCFCFFIHSFIVCCISSNKCNFVGAKKKNFVSTIYIVILSLQLSWEYINNHSTGQIVVPKKCQCYKRNMICYVIWNEMEFYFRITLEKTFWFLLLFGSDFSTSEMIRYRWPSDLRNHLNFPKRKHSFNYIRKLRKYIFNSSYTSAFFGIF